MRKVLIFTLILMLLVIAGCVPSLYPFYTNSDLIQDKNLEGIWVNDDGTEIWEFILASDSVSYELIQTEKGDTKHFETHLLKLDDHNYLDTYPDDEIKNDFYKIHLVSAHIFGKVEIRDDSMRLSLLDSDWLRDMFTKGKITIAHEIIDNNLVLTAGTGDLQNLVEKYANEPKAFCCLTTLHRK
ncbi:MAG TPA: hypothetical protein DEO84_01835 [candidate division Zixibacteria bacterium]|nr:hypothetical protein [candidate division Zixibacteria bacterium]HBZ00039.1 hypothetical protein [candidate division Zixibacteria bacterium]